MLIISNITDKFPLIANVWADGELVFSESDDNAVIKRLLIIASEYDISANEGKKLECFVIFEYQFSLWLFQTAGTMEIVFQNIDVFVTTIPDLMAKTLFVQLPSTIFPFPPLDRKAISRDSDDTVHLVIIGNSELVEALAINAALVAHYPNYCRNHRLRTRITLVDDEVTSLCDQFLQRYSHLFDHSYYRILDLNDENPKCFCHSPKYKDVREDFVDVEWEFVNGNLRNIALRQKLSEWACSDTQQLTVIICYSDLQRNLMETLSLPESIYCEEIPVLCHAEKSDILDIARLNSLYTSVLSFGSSICRLETLRMLKKLAKKVNYVYNYCFALDAGAPISAPSSIDEIVVDRLWAEIPSFAKRCSNIFNAMTLGTKMHSLGHDSSDWNTYYAVSMNEINLLTEVEHNRWNVEELILGYRPVTDEEQKMVEQDISLKKILRDKKVHYDLRAFSDLREDDTGKNVNMYDRVLTQGIPLIIKTCITN